MGGAEARHLFTEHAEEECIEGYKRLLRGMGMERYIPDSPVGGAPPAPPV